MNTNNDAQTRAVSTQPYSLRPYEDNCADVENLCTETGRKPGEVLRDLVDEALRLRRHLPAGPAGIKQLLEQLVEQNRMLVEQNQAMAARQEQLVKRYEELLDRNTREKKALSMNMREFYGLLLETLSAAIGARRLTWNYAARTVLRQSGYSDEQIGQRHEAETQACIKERDELAEALEQAINNLPAAGTQQSGASQAASAMTATPNQEEKKA